MEKPKTIFIVEDEGIVTMDISAMLGNRGFKISGTASNGADALAGIGKENPDIVLLDIILPGPMDGITVAERLKSAGNIPFIYLTAHSDETTLNRAKATGPHGFIVKPVNEVELYSTVVTALYKHAMEQKLREEHDLMLGIAETSPSAITVISPGGQIVFANSRAEAVLGLRREEIVSRSYESPQWKITDFKGRPIAADALPFAKVMKSGQPVFDMQHMIEAPGGKKVLLSINAAPLFDRSGNISMVVTTMEDITIRMKMESVIRRQNEELEAQNEELQASMEELEATNEELRATNEELTRSQDELMEMHSRLKESEEKFRLVFTTSPDSVNINRLADGLCIDINDGFTALTGYTREDVIGKSSIEINIWDNPDDRARLVEGLEKDGLVRNLEAVFRMKDGSKKTALMSARILQLNSVPHILSLTRDIDEMKKLDEQLKREMEITASSLAEKEILLREVHHRVKNNFQIIISMLNLQVKQIRDPFHAELFRDTQNRIRAMALIHEKLYRSHDLAHVDFAEYLNLMVTELQRLYTPSLRSIAVKVDTEDVSMGIDQAIPCGLILNELVTNAMKYAFPRERTGPGCITISLKHRGGGDVELSVCDDGIGIPENVDPETSESLGLTIVQLLAKHQLGGEIRFERRQGTECRLRFTKK